MYRNTRTVNSLKQGRKSDLLVREEGEWLYQNPGLREANSTECNMELWAPRLIKSKGNWWIQYILLNNNRTQTNILGETFFPLALRWEKSWSHSKKESGDVQEFNANCPWQKLNRKIRDVLCMFLLYTNYSLKIKRKQKPWRRTVGFLGRAKLKHVSSDLEASSGKTRTI